MAQPRTAKLTGTVQWSNGDNFNGFVAIGIATPNDADAVAYASISRDNTYPRMRLPIWTIVPISDGIFDQSTTLFFNEDLEPPGCRLVAYFYDINRKRIAPLTAGTLFDIDSNPYAISVPTLTAPTTTTTPITPQA